MDDGLASTSSENPLTTPESDETPPQTTDEASSTPSGGTQTFPKIANIK